MGVPRSGPVDASPRARELAKGWLVRVVERIPLAEVETLDLPVFSTSAAPLVAAILGELAEPAADLAAGPPPTLLRRAAEVARLRRGRGGAAEVARDLAALHSLLLEALAGDDGATGAERLAVIFGSIHGALAEAAVAETEAAARGDPLTGLPGSRELEEWLRVLDAEHQRYGQPFALALVGIDGVEEINRAYGRRSGDRMIAAVAAVVRGRTRAADVVFRLDDDLCVLAPHQDAEQLRPMADRLAAVVDGSQGAEEPRVAVAVGLAGRPTHAAHGRPVLGLATEAMYAARAAGRPVAVAAPATGGATEPDRPERAGGRPGLRVVGDGGGGAVSR